MKFQEKKCVWTKVSKPTSYNLHRYSHMHISLTYFKGNPSEKPTDQRMLRYGLTYLTIIHD